MPKTHVYADASRQFRGPDLFGPQGAVPGGTDGKGSFSFELPPGTYHIVASKRLTGNALGPLRPGDLHGYYDGNPLELAPGTTVALTLQAVEKLRDNLSSGRSEKSGTGIRGRVSDPSGKVPQGVYAFATTDPSFMIGAMPPHRSQPIGPDGSYFIEIPSGGGTFYVSARSGHGGPPLPGEWHGFHGDAKPSPVVVESDRVTGGIDIVLNPAGWRPESGRARRADPPSSRGWTGFWPERPSPPLRMTPKVIESGAVSRARACR